MSRPVYLGAVLPQKPTDGHPLSIEDLFNTLIPIKIAPVGVEGYKPTPRHIFEPLDGWAFCLYVGKEKILISFSQLSYRGVKLPSGVFCHDGQDELHGWLNEEAPPWHSVQQHATISPNGTIILSLTDYDYRSFSVEVCYSEYTAKILRTIYEQYSTDEQDESLPSPEKSSKEKGSVMSNPMNFGIIPIEDENINGTPLGIAVRTPGGGWNIYDQEKNTITDLGNIPLGNFPIWEIPAFKVKPGDTIINDNKYYHVTAVEDGYISTIDIAAGVKEEQVKAKNIVGLSIYRKVVSCADLLGGKKHNVDDKLLLLMLGGSIQGQGDDTKQQAPNIFLPLMFMNNIDEKSIDKLLALSMMTNGGQGDQNNLMQLLLAKELLSDNGLECLGLDFGLGSNNNPNPDSNNVEPASGITNSD